MKLIPHYSLEYNTVLNPQLDEHEQIKNFASLLTDKDRFMDLLQLIEMNEDLIEKKLGFSLPPTLDFYIVRCEQFKSFSEPITIEYSLLPEEMIVFLLKELLKVCAVTRFPDEVTREQYLNSLFDRIAIEGNWGEIDLVKYGKTLHELAKEKHPEYEFQDIDYSSKSLKQYVEDMYNA